MRIFRTKRIPARNYDAINLFGMLFVHPGVMLSEELINHERIHTKQMVEMLFLPFYIWYVVEWLIRIPMKGRAYTSISFEREAYGNMNDLDYLKKRKPYAWVKYLRKKKRANRNLL